MNLSTTNQTRGHNAKLSAYNWTKKNVLSELPIVGPYFSCCESTEAWKHTGKQIAANIMMYGGMYYSMALKMPMMNSVDIHTDTAIMMGEMHAYMFMGKISFNCIYNLGENINYYFFTTKNSNDLEQLSDLEAPVLQG